MTSWIERRHIVSKTSIKYVWVLCSILTFEDSQLMIDVASSSASKDFLKISFDLSPTETEGGNE